MNPAKTMKLNPYLRKKYASEFARAGGLAGGPARASKLTPDRRKEIARNAALTRWAKKINNDSNNDASCPQSETAE
jgi:hypothetical protein